MVTASRVLSFSTEAAKASRVARRRHPTFSFAGTTAFLVLLAMILVGWARGVFASADAAQGYRLAGTIAVGSDFLAFLATPDGAQVLVHEGDAVGNARVRDIRDREIDLALPSGLLTLSLDRSDKPVVGTPAREVLVSQSSDEYVLGREVSVAPFRKAVSASSSNSSSASVALAQRVAPVLDLPPHSRILAVNGQDVTSADGAIREIAKVLAAGSTVTMNLETPTGLKRVYVTPQRAEQTPAAP